MRRCRAYQHVPGFRLRIDFDVTGDNGRLDPHRQILGRLFWSKMRNFHNFWPMSRMVIGAHLRRFMTFLADTCCLFV